MSRFWNFASTSSLVFALGVLGHDAHHRDAGLHDAADGVQRQLRHPAGLYLTDGLADGLASNMIHLTCKLSIFRIIFSHAPGEAYF